MRSLSLSVLTLCLAIRLSLCFNGTHQTAISINQCQFTILIPKENFTFLYCQTPKNTHQSIWEDCINECCYGMAGYNYPDPDYDVLTLCQQRSHPNEEKDDGLMIIGVSVAGGLIFVGSMIITCRIVTLICDNRVTHVDSNQVGDDVNSFTIGDAADIQWRKCEQQGHISADVVCSICLEGDPFVQLACRHAFHSQCIGVWLRKSQFCPNCNSKQNDRIKYYCEKFHQGYFIIKKRVFIGNLEALRKVRCKSCQKLEESEEGGRASTSWRCEYGNNRMEKSTENVLVGI